jgi:hypothetical protein
MGEWSATVLCHGAAHGQTAHTLDMVNQQRRLGGSLSLLKPVLLFDGRSMGRQQRNALSLEKTGQRVTSLRLQVCSASISLRRATK